MPSYDFRCKQCGVEFSLFYKTYAAYDEATRACPQCSSQELARVIRRVNVQAASQDYSRMGVGDMLSVFESGDSKQVGKMFDQIGGTNPALAQPYHEATKRLLGGESLDTVERSLQQRDGEQKAAKSEPAKKPAKRKSKSS
jgi:putative FmdB family regulatory protein